VKKVAEEFVKCKSKKDGLSCYCKYCYREISKKYNQKIEVKERNQLLHKQRYKDLVFRKLCKERKKRYLQNPKNKKRAMEQAREYAKEYRNRLGFKETRKKYLQGLTVKMACKIRWEKYSQSLEGRKKLQEYKQRLIVKERMRLYDHNRRTLKRRIQGELTKSEWLLLLKIYNQRKDTLSKQIN
jgi:hypothetical protein